MIIVWSDKTTQVFPFAKTMRTNRRISNFIVISHPSTCSKWSPPPDVEKNTHPQLFLVHTDYVSVVVCCARAFLTEVFYSFSRTILAFFISTLRSLVQSTHKSHSKNFLVIVFNQYGQNWCFRGCFKIVPYWVSYAIKLSHILFFILSSPNLLQASSRNLGRERKKLITFFTQIA